MDLHIIPECFVDTNLTETLVPPTRNGYNHQHGCGSVARVMNLRLADDFALGIIDNDKHELDYARDFQVISQKGALELMKHSTRNHYLIRIGGGIERFILNCAAQVHVDPSQYELPAELAAFRLESKTENSKRDVRFKRLFRAILHADHPDFLRLQQWVDHLKSNPYQASQALLASL